MPHTSLDYSFRVAEKIRTAIENNSNPIVGNYTVSFGVAERKIDEDYDELYKRMDKALYKAKELGKNRVVKAQEDYPTILRDSLEWNTKWNTGENMLDAQHKEMVALIKTIKENTLNSDEKELSRDVDVLLRQVERHHLYEEKVLEDLEYPDRTRHKKIHFYLIEKVYLLREQVRQGEKDLSELIDYIEHDLIIGHLLKEDTKFFPYIQENSLP